MIRVFLLTLAYFVTGWFGLKLPYAGTHITLIWLPTGIAVAALFRWGRSVWPGISLGAFLVNFAIGSSWPLAAAIAVGNTLGPLLSAAWLERVGFHSEFDRRIDVGSLVVAAGLGMTVSALGGVTSLYLAGLVPSDHASSAMLAWWLGDSIGVLLAAPLLLSFTRENLEQLIRARMDLLFWLPAAGAVAWIALIHDYQGAGRALPLAFLTMPLLTWAGLRFGTTGAALAGLGFSVIAAWVTASGHGAFVLPDVRASLILLWIYMATTVLTGFMITALQAERLKVEKDLRVITNSLNDAQHIAHIGSWRLDIPSGKLTWSDEIFRLFEIDPNQFSATYEGFLNAIHPEDRDMVNRAYTESISQRTPYAITHRLLMNDGRIKWVHEHGSTDFDEAGKPLLSQGTVQDITERKQAEETAELASQYARSLIEASLDPLVTISAEGKITDVNTATEKVTGLKRGQLIGSDFANYFTDPEKARTGYQQVFIQGFVTDYPLAIRHTSGKITEVLYNASVYRDGDGNVLGVFAAARDITERKRIEAKLTDSEARLRTIIENEPECIKIVDAEGRIVQINPAGLRMLEADRPDQVVGKSILDLIPTEYRKPYANLHERVLAGDTMQMEFEVIGFKGGHRWLETHAVPMQETTGNVVQLSVTRDITERKQAEHQLRIAATVFESQDGMMVTDAHNVILSVNKAFTEISGYPAEEIIGKKPKIMHSGRQSEEFYSTMWKSINSTGSWRGEIWNRRKNGEIYPEYLTITAVKDQNGIVTHFVGTHTDITLRKAAAEEIERLAFYDPLTDLPNRRLLQEHLKSALAASHRHGRNGALLFIDLDNFKAINDTLGHDMGDLLLQQVAKRLSSCIREGDTVARLGGDEFVVMLEDLSDGIFEAAKQAETIGNKIRGILNQPYQLGSNDYISTPSIGATLFKGHKKSVDELLKHADIAMYQAKTSGRNTLRFFEPRMQDAIMARVSLEEELRKALGQHQFQLYYQVQVEMSHRPMGAEALIRWSHPDRGMVSPAEFIPLAEATGLILPIGQWVLETACAQIKAWQQDPLTRDLVLSVNVSAKQFFQSNFVTQVQTAIQQQGIDPMRLKLELTESLLIENVEDTISIMNALVAIGVRFSLDDFGTGYSSLQYLKKLPLHQLKIDQSFVRDIDVDRGDQAIVRTIIAMAESLGLSVIAEGVETEQQLLFLQNKGCKNYQGFLFGKPLPIEQFEALLKEGSLDG